ncbi:MAG: hypothetical protein ACXWTT_12705 [Methylobacter sp.]
MLYRQNRVAGGTYFCDFARPFRRCAGAARRATARRISHGGAEKPFTIDAIAILPDHLHAVWTLPDGDANYYGRWRAIKSCFTRELRISDMPLTLANPADSSACSTFTALMIHLLFFEPIKCHISSISISL